jgi:hypothetical protein
VERKKKISSPTRTIECTEFEVDSKIYLRSEANQLFDQKSHDLLGEWDEETKTINFNEDAWLRRKERAMLKANIQQATKAAKLTVEEFDNDDKTVMIRQHYCDIVEAAKDENIAIKEIMSTLKDKDYVKMLVDQWKHAKAAARRQTVEKYLEEEFI